MNVSTSVMEGDVTAFYDLWAELRSRPARGSHVAGDDVRVLGELAPPEALPLLAALEIETGQLANEPDLLTRGLARMRDADLDEWERLLECFPDATILGAPARRKHVLRAFWNERLGRGSAALRLLHATDGLDPAAFRSGLADVVEILGQLPSNQSQAMRLQLGWHCLERWSEHRDASWIQLSKEDSLQLHRSEASHWEHLLIGAVRSAMLGFSAESLAQIRVLSEGPAQKGWRRRHVQRVMTSFAALTSPHARAWVAAIPGGPFTPKDSTSDLEMIGSTLAACLTSGDRRPDKTVREVVTLVSHRPNDAFLLLLELEDGRAREELLAVLLATTREDATMLQALPWSGREEAFGRACSSARTSEQAFLLLAHCAAARQSSTLARYAVVMLDQMDGRVLRRTPNDILAPLLSPYRELLSETTRRLLARDLVYRAVIDGSNLVLAGTHHGRGPTRMRFLKQTYDDLSAAGFREVITFFDASTRHKATREEWASVEELQSQNRASVIRGAADPKIIECFLQDPAGSWIVTTDDYRDHLETYQELKPFWFRNRLDFFVDHDGRIAWNRPLDQATLPQGVPTGPGGRR
jgi:hypothetical protein